MELGKTRVMDAPTSSAGRVVLRVLLVIVAALAIASLYLWIRQDKDASPGGQDIPESQEIESLIEALGSQLERDRDSAFRRLMDPKVDARNELDLATLDSNLKRAAGARRIRFVKGLRLEDTKRVLVDIGRTARPSWRYFSWLATALLEDLWEGAEWPAASKAIEEQGFQLLSREEIPSGDTDYLLRIPADVFEMPDWGSLIVKLRVDGRWKQIYSTGVGLRTEDKFSREWKQLCERETDLAFLPELLNHDQLKQTWEKGFTFSRVSILCGRYPQGLPREPSPESPSGFTIACDFTNAGGWKTRRAEFVVESDLGPFEEWRARVEGYGPQRENTVGHPEERAVREAYPGNSYFIKKKGRKPSEVHTRFYFAGHVVHDAKELREAGRVEAISFQGYELTPEAQAELLRREELTALDVSSVADLDRNAMKNLSRLKRLKSLVVGRIEEDALDQCSFETVTSLAFHHTQFTPKLAGALKSFQGVKQLYLDEVSGPTVDILKGVAQMEALEEIDINCYKDTLVEILGLAGANRLKKMSVSYAMVLGLTDTRFKSMGSLRRLKLRNAGVMDLDLASIAAHEGLEEVQLIGLAWITDEGIMNFKRMANLGSLEILGCSEVSPNGVQALQAALGDQFDLERR